MSHADVTVVVIWEQHLSYHHVSTHDAAVWGWSVSPAVVYAVAIDRYTNGPLAGCGHTVPVSVDYPSGTLTVKSVAATMASDHIAC